MTSSQRSVLEPSAEELAHLTQRPLLFPNFTKYLLVSNAIALSNTGSSLKPHMPFRRTCIRMLMSSVTEDIQLDKAIEDLEEKQHTFMEADHNLISAMIFTHLYVTNKASITDFLEDVVEPLAPEAAAAASKQSREATPEDSEETPPEEQAEADDENNCKALLAEAQKSGRLHRHAFWLMEQEALLHVLKLGPSNVLPATTDVLSQDMRRWMRSILQRFVLHMVTCLLTQYDKTTYDTIWKAWESVLKSDPRLRAVVSRFVVWPWYVGKQAFAVQAYRVAQHIATIGEIISPPDSRNQCLFLAEQGECLYALSDDNPEIQKEAIVTLKRITEHPQVNDSLKRTAIFRMAWIYRNELKQYDKAIECFEIRRQELEGLDNVYPHALANCYYFIARCHQKAGDLEAMRKWGLDGIAVFDRKDEYRKGELAIQYAKCIEALTWKLEHIDWSEAAKWIHKGIKVLDDEIRRARQEEGETHPAKELIYDTLYTKLAMGTLLTNRFIDEDARSEYESRFPSDPHAAQLAYVEDKLKQATRHLRPDYPWLWGFYSQTQALLAERKGDKEATLGHVLALLLGKAKDGKMILCDLPGVRTVDDLENRVLFPPSSTEQTEIPMDVLMARCKETDMGYVETLGSAIRVCCCPTRGQPPTRKVRMSKHWVSKIEEYIPECGTEPYQDLLHEMLQCVEGV